MSGRFLIYYKYDSMGGDRFFKGDRYIRRPLRRLIRGPDPVGGIDLVFLNLVAGLEKLGAHYIVNLPFDQIRPDDKVGVIGRDRASLEGYRADNPILAGVAVAQHPEEWPTLFEDYPIARYVVHCDWVKFMFEQHYGPRIVTWAVGIDTDAWSPVKREHKTVDFLIYDKIRWDKQRVDRAMLDGIHATLKRRGLSTEIIRYGAYKPNDLKEKLGRARSLLFLCEHETQGLAYQQAMSAGLPVLAWDPGQWLDPWRFRYSDVNIPATTVPFFDSRCGLTFKSAADFETQLVRFLSLKADGVFAPRDYVEENLSLAGCAQIYLDLLRTYC